ncbi:Hemolysin ahh1 [Datura stramonium]|uniref:Adenosylhomocysteinase n=1 Tax=Datura stramonium TaxID=4076 RepID=A0ABS8S880_DATST|nr:Hemolysin ahh1 [Datura stramonium]
MALIVEKTTSGREQGQGYVPGRFRRLEIELAEVEMPGLMACRGSNSAHLQPFKDHAAAAIARDSAAVFAWKGETLQEYWWCTERALDWGPGGGPDLIVDDGGDATLLIHEGVKAEEEYAKTLKLLDPSVSTDNAEFQLVLTIIRDGLKTDPLKYTKMKERLVGVSEETTTGVKRLYQMQANGTLLFPAINVNDSVTKSKFDNLYGCRHSLPDGLMRATDVMIAGKAALLAGHGDVGKGCAAALKQGVVIVRGTEIDPICALQAAHGRPPGLLEDVVSDVDIFVTTTGRESQSSPKPTDGSSHTNSGIIVLARSSSHELLGCATGHPSFVMSCSFTNQVIAQLELWKEKASRKYEKKGNALPKHLDEKVAALHLESFVADLSFQGPS